MSLGLALLASLILLGGVWISLKHEILAASLKESVLSAFDPAIQKIAVTASLPISDTRLNQGTAKTIYFRNDEAGIITLTFGISGTPEMIFMPGVAFGQTHGVITATDAAFTATIDYAVWPTHTASYVGFYTVTNAMGQVVVPITYMRDITRPVVEIRNLPAGVFTGTVFQVEGVADDNTDGAGIQVVKVKTDTTNWQTAIGAEVWEWPASFPIVDGRQYTVATYAMDYVGLKSLVDTETITVDNFVSDPENLGSVIPTNMWIPMTSLPVTWTKVDDFNSPVVYYYTLTTAAPCTVMASDAHTTSLAVTLPVTESNIYTFCLRTRDNVSNWASETAALGPFKADNKPPVIIITSPEEGSVLTTTHLTTMTIKGTATDQHSGVAGVSVTMGLGWFPAVGTNNWSYEWDLPIEDNKFYTITVRARDNTGNWSTTSRHVWVDTRAPIVAVPIPNRSPWITSTVIYTWTPAVDNIGIRDYRVWITNTNDYSESFLTLAPTLIYTEAFSEGVKYYARVRATDKNGNTGVWSDSSNAVTPDLSSPTISTPEVIHNVPDYLHVVDYIHLYYTNTMSAGAIFRLQGYSEDALSGVARVSFSEAFGESPADVTSGFQPWKSGFYIIEYGDDASGVINAHVYDRLENTAIQTFTYELDGQGPYTGTVVINDGATYVTQTLVSLALWSDDIGSGVAEMCIIQSDEACDANAWELYHTTSEWTLAGSDGLKTIYVWYRDHLKNVSGPYSSTIFLDRVTPTGTVTIVEGAYTRQVTVTLALSATDVAPSSGVVQMRVRQGGEAWGEWKSYGNSETLRLSGDDGEKMVGVQYRDGAGNESDEAQAAVLLDRVTPTGTVTIVEGAYTRQVTVTLALSATDVAPSSGVVQMRVRQGGEAWGEWKSYGNSETLRLSGDDGEKMVGVQYRDGAGNESDEAQAAVLLDRVAPSVLVTVPVQLAAGPIPVAWLAVDPEPSSGNFLYTVQYRLQNSDDWTGWLTDTSSIAASFSGPALDNTYTFRVMARDAAGNMGEKEASTVYRYFRVFLPLTVRNYALFANGDFGSGSLKPGWNSLKGGFPGYGGSGLPQQVIRFEENYRALLGDINAQNNAIPVGYGSIAQTFTVNKPYLTLKYRIVSYDIFKGTKNYFDTFEISINSSPNQILDSARNEKCAGVPGTEPGIQAEAGLTFCRGREGNASVVGQRWDSGWRTVTLDMKNFQWTTITLYLAIWNREYEAPYFNDYGWYNTWVYLDDISLHE